MCEKSQFQENREKKIWVGVGGQGRSGNQKHRYFFLGLIIFSQIFKKKQNSVFQIKWVTKHKFSYFC